MFLRRAFYGWLLPAAVVLPLWLFVGWGVFNAGGWAFAWVLLVALPSVFVGQLVLALLVRARGSVRAEHAVSWWDVLGFTIWHGLTIFLGFFMEAWWAPAMVATVASGIALLWLQLWQLWREASASVRTVLRTAEGMAYLSPTGDDSVRTSARQPAEVIVISESGSPRPGYTHPGGSR